ncbi:hypothetical protein Hdeb2414_s0486g00903281 [Helianthus debilis subsp. tardiflorus]
MSSTCHALNSNQKRQLIYSFSSLNRRSSGSNQPHLIPGLPQIDIGETTTAKSQGHIDGWLLHKPQPK